MTKIAIVEDDAAFRETLQNYLHRMEQSGAGEYKFSIDCFQDGLSFLDSYRPDFQIVLMDIEMPYMDGMKAAQKLRELDDTVCLIFITNMAQYVFKGYEVSAMDFILKPVSYETFSFKMEKAIAAANRFGRQEKLLKTESGYARIAVSDIYYIEVVQHTLLYLTVRGAFEVWGIMAKAEEEFSPLGFARCNVSYLVNLRHVMQVRGDYVTVGGDQLKISRSYKKDFMQSIMLFYSQGGSAAR